MRTPFCIVLQCFAIFCFAWCNCASQTLLSVSARYAHQICAICASQTLLSVSARYARRKQQLCASQTLLSVSARCARRCGGVFHRHVAPSCADSSTLDLHACDATRCFDLLPDVARVARFAAFTSSAIACYDLVAQRNARRNLMGNMRVMQTCHQRW